MVVCELDNDVSGDLMGWKLPTWQALLLHRALPSCGGLIIYLTLICFDLTLIYTHFESGNNGIAVFSIILMVIPAVITLIFTLASPPPGLKTDDDTIKIDIRKKDVYWILKQILSFLVFPLAAIGRYCHQIFWWIESVFASHANDDNRIEEALQRAREPSPIELYLFLQAFLHAAPHAVLNVLEMMVNIRDPMFEKVSLQGVSLVVSSLRMASTATLYRRFEREKISGRQYPWNTNATASLDNKVNEIIKQEMNKQNYELPTPSPTEKENDSIHSTDDCHWSKYQDLIDLSDSDSGELPPIEAYNRKVSAADSDHEYIRPISIIDRVAPRRRDTQYTIEVVDVPPPPAMPAPTPARVSVWAEKLVENAESIPTWLSAPPRRRHYEEIIQDEPDIPTHVPRAYIRGLEPQDASAALVNFLGWYMFFVARLLSIAAFISAFPMTAIIILFAHYQIMLLFLIVPQASSIRRGFYIFLAFIYLFCLMEFKVRFRHVRVWHVFWIIVCTLEIVIFTALWATINNQLTAWWREYVVIVIFGATILSYMCMLVYFVLLKPKETIVPMKNQK